MKNHYNLSFEFVLTSRFNC